LRFKKWCIAKKGGKKKSYMILVGNNMRPVGPNLRKRKVNLAGVCIDQNFFAKPTFIAFSIHISCILYSYILWMKRLEIHFTYSFRKWFFPTSCEVNSQGERNWNKVPFKNTYIFCRYSLIMALIAVCIHIFDKHLMIFQSTHKKVLVRALFIKV